MKTKGELKENYRTTRENQFKKTTPRLKNNGGRYKTNEN